MGLPTIATDIRGNRQVVHHEHTGLLIPVRSPDAIADAIASLIQQRHRWPSLGAAAIATAAAEFDQQRVIERTLDAYRGIQRS